MLRLFAVIVYPGFLELKLDLRTNIPKKVPHFISLGAGQANFNRLEMGIGKAMTAVVHITDLEGLLRFYLNIAMFRKLLIHSHLLISLSKNLNTIDRRVTALTATHHFNHAKAKNISRLMPFMLRRMISDIVSG
jgi:hypothetical protein